MCTIHHLVVSDGRNLGIQSWLYAAQTSRVDENEYILLPIDDIKNLPSSGLVCITGMSRSPSVIGQPATEWQSDSDRKLIDGIQRSCWIYSLRGDHHRIMILQNSNPTPKDIQIESTVGGHNTNSNDDIMMHIVIRIISLIHIQHPTSSDDSFRT